MGRFIIALAIVIVFVASAFIAFRRSPTPRPSREVLDRVKAREKLLEAKERSEGDD